YSTTSQYLSGRLVHLTTYLTAVVLLTSYSASLISSITIGPHGVPFGSFEDFLSDGTYSLAVMANSYAVTYFKLTHPGKGDRYRFTWNFQDFGEKYGFMVRLIFSEEAAFHVSGKNSSNSILKEVYFKHIVPIEASLPGTTLEALEMTCTHSKFATMSFDT
ncbi:hypothetical protein ANN_00839, partial [Periplaneta americana]